MILFSPSEYPTLTYAQTEWQPQNGRPYRRFEKSIMVCSWCWHVELFETNPSANQAELNFLDKHSICDSHFSELFKIRPKNFNINSGIILKIVYLYKINLWKRERPSGEICETPHFIGLDEDIAKFTLTSWVLPLR